MKIEREDIILLLKWQKLGQYFIFYPVVKWFSLYPSISLYIILFVAFLCFILIHIYIFFLYRFSLALRWQFMFFQKVLKIPVNFLFFILHINQSILTRWTLEFELQCCWIVMIVYEKLLFCGWLIRKCTVHPTIIITNGILITIIHYDIHFHYYIHKKQGNSSTFTYITVSLSRSDSHTPHQKKK